MPIDDHAREIPVAYAPKGLKSRRSDELSYHQASGRQA